MILQPGHEPRVVDAQKGKLVLCAGGLMVVDSATAHITIDLSLYIVEYLYIFKCT